MLHLVIREPCAAPIKWRGTDWGWLGVQGATEHAPRLNEEEITEEQVERVAQVCCDGG